MDIEKEKILVIKYHNFADEKTIKTSINDVSTGDTILIHTEEGWQFADIVNILPFAEFKNRIKDYKVKKATEEDLERLQHIKQRETEAFVNCEQFVEENNISMKLVKTVLSPDGSKITFYYTAEDRVDFRELVVELASKLRVRIEMRQIGVRDEARMLGGLGICSRKLCCSSSLHEFKPITIKMVKKQNISISPEKISGLCGRLMCCFCYEIETYDNLSEKMPEIGDKVYYKNNPAIVEDVRYLKEEILINLGDDTYKIVNPDEITNTRPIFLLPKFKKDKN